MASGYARAEELAMRESSAAPQSLGRANSLSSTLARAEARMWSHFDKAGVDYPPRKVTLIALKHEARMEVWAGDGADWKFIRSYLVQAASGRLGPKLKQGDRQIPEGVYRITGLNPQSRYHLSMRIDYPNAFDRSRARLDRRLAPLGGDIMIHGGRDSIGCIAVGDRAIEEIFALASRVGTGDVAVIVSPVDFRRTHVYQALTRISTAPSWAGGLYYAIADALAPFPLPADEKDSVPLTIGELGVTRAECDAHELGDCAQRCERGDVPSCTLAGLMHRDGRDAPVDSNAAWTFLRKGCEGADALGCAELSQLYLEDDGLRRDVGFSAELARAACDGGESLGCTYLANICVDEIVYGPMRDLCTSENVQRLRDRAISLAAYRAPVQSAASIAGVSLTRKSWTGSSARPTTAHNGK